MLIARPTTSGARCPSRAATIACGVIAIVAETDFVASVTEVAVTVTVVPGGTVSGAVYVVATSLPVIVGFNEPHAVPPHVTVQVT